MHNATGLEQEIGELYNKEVRPFAEELGNLLNFKQKRIDAAPLVRKENESVNDFFLRELGKTMRIEMKYSFEKAISSLDISDGSMDYPQQNNETLEKMGYYNLSEDLQIKMLERLIANKKSIVLKEERRIKEMIAPYL
jgi:hypothetical protein